MLDYDGQRPWGIDVKEGDLLFILGVCVWIVDDDCVCTLQIQAPAGCPDREQEYEGRAVFSIESRNVCLPAYNIQAWVFSKQEEKFTRLASLPLCEVQSIKS